MYRRTGVLLRLGLAGLLISGLWATAAIYGSARDGDGAAAPPQGTSSTSPAQPAKPAQLAESAQSAESARPTQPLEFFPLSSVRKGLRGIAKTVVEGTKVDTFDVEVLGVLKGAGPAGDLILIRASGKVIDQTGGIAAGMSGSPVYIDGKLLGAIGFGFNMADHTVGMVTPVADMMRVMELAEKVPEQKVPGQTNKALLEVQPLGSVGVGSIMPFVDGDIKLGDKVISGVAVAPTPVAAKELQQKLGDSVLVMAPVATPVLVGGLGDRAFQRLQSLLAGYPITLVRAGASGRASSMTTSSADPAAHTEIEPGSAFGAQMVRGDVDLTAIGTVTAVSGNHFVGFGHPFLNKGSVDFYATGAYIHLIVPSIEAPFKLGSPTEPIGTLSQDRAAAVGGRLGSMPSFIPLSLRVRDVDTGRITETNVEVARDELLTVPLVAVAALQGLDRSIDRIGAGTAQVTFEIEGDGLSKKITRDNMVYSPFDVSAMALFETLDALEMVLSNPFEAVRATGVRLDLRVETARKTARIEKAGISESEVAPGESVDVEVTLRPFRGKPETKVIRLTIPKDTPTGDVMVTVRGGGEGYPFFKGAIPAIPDENSQGQTEEDKADPTQVPTMGATSLEELVNQFLEREKNNDLVAEFYPPYDGGSEAGRSAGQHENPDAYGDEPSDVAESAHATPWGRAAIAQFLGLAARTEDKAPSPSGKSVPPSGTPWDDPNAVKPIKAVLSTRYVVEGSLTLNLTIVDKKDSKKPVTPGPPSSTAPSTSGEPSKSGDPSK